MRLIVKNAMRVDELSNQFEVIDMMDWETVDSFYPDKYIVNEARWRLEIAVAQLRNYTTQNQITKVGKGMRVS